MHGRKHALHGGNRSRNGPLDAIPQPNPEIAERFGFVPEGDKHGNQCHNARYDQHKRVRGQQTEQAGNSALDFRNGRNDFRGRFQYPADAGCQIANKYQHRPQHGHNTANRQDDILCGIVKAVEFLYQPGCGLYHLRDARQQRAHQVDKGVFGFVQCLGKFLVGGVGDFLECFICCLAAILHLGKDFVVICAAVAGKHHCGRTGFDTAEHVFQRLAILGGGIRKHIQNVGCRIALGFQIGKAFARQFAQGGVGDAAGLCKFVQHGF